MTQAKHDPWIGHVTDGRRDVVEVRDQYGRTAYVHIDGILLDCELHMTPDAAREWAARMGLDRYTKRRT